MKGSLKMQDFKIFIFHIAIMVLPWIGIGFLILKEMCSPYDFDESKLDDLKTLIQMYFLRMLS